MFCHCDFQELILYCNRFIRLKYEVVNCNHRSSCDSDSNSAVISVCSSLLRILGALIGYFGLDRNLCGNDFHAVNLGRAITFFIERHGKESREKRNKLLKHWHELRVNVLEKWTSLEPFYVQHIEGLRPALKDHYLNSSSIFRDKSTWHKLTIQHICDKDDGYPAICSAFDYLKIHEKNHNVSVALLLGILDDEIKILLEKLPNLKSVEDMKNNFYSMKNILYVLHNPEVPLNIVDDELWANSDRRIARSDGEILQKLKDGIERIRLAHKNAFEKVENGKLEDKKILVHISKLVDDIIYGLSLEKPLKGQCDYERSLDE